MNNKVKQNSRDRQPAFQFYAGDWLTDPSLRMCSFETRGVWIDLLCIMFLSDEIGVLKIGNQILDENGVRNLVKMSPKKFKKVWNELIIFGIVKCDESGRFFSKRMVGDERIRQVRREVGKLGGNPKLIKEVGNLVKQKDNQNPTPSSSSSSSSSYNTNNEIICMADNDLVDHGKIHFLMDYVADNFPNVAKIKNQLTNDQCENLEAEFSRAEIIEVLEAMENHSNVTKKYMSVSLTLKNWIKIRKQNVKQQQQNGRSKPDFDDTIRKF
jgi:hypothetical protein